MEMDMYVTHLSEHASLARVGPISGCYFCTGGDGRGISF